MHIENDWKGLKQDFLSTFLNTRFPKLYSLDLTENHLETFQINSLLIYLSSPQNQLISLDLSSISYYYIEIDCNISATDMSIFFRQIGKNSLTSGVINEVGINNNESDESMKKCGVEILYLNDNKFGDLGVCTIKLLPSNCVNIKELYLDDNDLKEDGAYYLAEMLYEHPEKLEVLSLNNNSIGLNGLNMIKPYFAYLGNLLQLNIRNIGEENLKNANDLKQWGDTLFEIKSSNSNLIVETSLL